MIPGVGCERSRPSEWIRRAEMGNRLPKSTQRATKSGSVRTTDHCATTRGSARSVRESSVRGNPRKNMKKNKNKKKHKRRSEEGKRGGSGTIRRERKQTGEDQGSRAPAAITTALVARDQRQQRCVVNCDRKYDVAKISTGSDAGTESGESLARAGKHRRRRHVGNSATGPWGEGGGPW